jgi:plasmid stabilization system protein ParE
VKRLDLTEIAQADLASIRRYSSRTWGRDQTAKYMDALRAGELVGFASSRSAVDAMIMAVRERLLNLPTNAVERGVPREHLRTVEDLARDVLDNPSALTFARGPDLPAEAEAGG